MATYTHRTLIYIGTTGLTLRAQLISDVAVNVGSAITTGFAEIAQGWYMWSGAIDFGTFGAIKFYDLADSTNFVVQRIDGTIEAAIRLLDFLDDYTPGGSGDAQESSVQKILGIVQAR